ncbi:hypothetical protein D1818_07035 [Aquimarina sp. BL5]|nr:hypothetical protein D1818_07035 [Aquimarina sp. BL5]
MISSLYSCSQESQIQNLIFTGKSIEEAIKFEVNLNSKVDKNYATIVLAPELYPYVDKYDLNNPKQISRVIPNDFPANIEYYYDKNSREVKYSSYKWAFFNRIDDETLFNRKKLQELVEAECDKLNKYSDFFSKLEQILDNKYSSSKKSILKTEPKEKLIEWENDNSKATLKLEFQDCNDKKKLLPGWFMISFIEYSK